MFPFYTPWKHQSFSGVFMGYKMGTLEKWVNDNSDSTNNLGIKKTLVVIIMRIMRNYCDTSNISIKQSFYQNTGNSTFLLLLILVTIQNSKF